MKTVLGWCLLALAATPAAAQPAVKPLYYGNVQCLYFGVEDYQLEDWKKTPGCEKDVDALSDLFVKRFGYTTHTKLVNAKATRKGIQDAVAAAAAAAGEDDVLVLYFAMHGAVLDFGKQTGRHGYFVPHDAAVPPDSRTKAAWDASALPMSWVLDATKRDAPKPCKARHVVIIADTCCAGGLTGRGEYFADASLRTLIKHPSRRVMAATTATAGTQTAFGGEGGGLFTKELIKTLTAADDAQSMLDVFLTVRKGVIASTGGKMIPQCEAFSATDGEFIFLPQTRQTRSDVAFIQANLEKGPAPLRADLGRGIHRMSERLTQRTTVADVVEAFEADDYRYSKSPREGAQKWATKLGRLEENAAIDQPLAMAALVYCYAKGLGTEPDPKLAYQWALAAYDTGHPAGRHVFGKCLMEAIGCDANRVAGRHEVDMAAEKQFPISLYVRGVRRHDAKDDDGAFKDWLAASSAGVSRAVIIACQTILSDQPADDARLEKVIQTLAPAAKKGSSEAAFVAAECRAKQAKLAATDKALDAAQRQAKVRSLRADCETYLRAAADRGWAAAQYVYARENLSADNNSCFDADRWLDLKPDVAEAVAYADLAVRQKHMRTHILLAGLLERSNPKRAVALLQVAIDAQEPGAFVLNAQWYGGDRVVGVEKDNVESLKWAYKAHKLQSDHMGANVWLAALYADGQHPQNADLRAALKSYLAPNDFAQGVPVFQHYALRHAIEALRAGNVTTPREIVKETAALLRKNPNATFWTFFKRDFPDAVADFNRFAGTDFK